MKFVPMPVVDILHLSEAADIDTLTSACASLVKTSPHVKLHLAKLQGLCEHILAAKPVDWSWVFDPHSHSEADRLFDAAFNASLNGGYFYRDPKTAEVRQWEIGGSGSSALTAWIKGLREKKLLPGRDQGGLGSEGSYYLEMIGDELEGIPYADERLEVCAEFADPSRRVLLNALVRDVTENGFLTVKLEYVHRLADIYPAGLQSDPLSKKAILAFMFLAGSMASRGHSVFWAAGAPMDYQLPRILEWKGVIEVSPEFEQTLRCPMALLPIDSEHVYHMRAAAFVAIEALSELAQVPSWLVDSALFLGFRKNPDFISGSLPPMRVDGTWF